MMDMGTDDDEVPWVVGGESGEGGRGSWVDRLHYTTLLHYYTTLYCAAILVAAPPSIRWRYN